MVRKSAKGTGDFYQYVSRRKVFTMDDLLDIPETEDYLTADLATSPLDTTQNEPEVEITGLEDTDLKEVYRGMGYEVVIVGAW